MTTPQFFQFQPWFNLQTPETISSSIKPLSTLVENFSNDKWINMGIAITAVLIGLFLLDKSQMILLFGLVMIWCLSKENFISGHPMQERRGIIPSERERSDGREKGDKDSLSDQKYVLGFY